MVLAVFEAAQAAYASGQSEEPGGTMFRWLEQLAADGAFASQPIVNTVLRFAQGTFSRDPAWARFVVDDGSELELLERSLTRYAATVLDECTHTAPVVRALPATVEAGPVQDYAPTGRYAVGDRVLHPRFGVGIVEKVMTAKIEARFESGTKILVSG